MSMQEDDLDLLLSLQDRVLETPPASPPSTSHPVSSAGHLSDDGSPNRLLRNPDLSVFRDAVQDYLDYEPEPDREPSKLNKRPSNISTAPEVEKFSGLRIRNQLVSPAELNNLFADIRFVQFKAIKNSLMGDTLSGSWATVGVLCEKGNPRTSSAGKSYSIWKFGCLDETIISVFLFGDAYQKNNKEKPGAVFALLNCNVRKDDSGSGFSLSVYSAGQILKMGTAFDYGVCKGKRKDGMACTLVINKRRGVYCKYHNSKSSEKYFTKRTELMGSNLRTVFGAPLKSEGIHLVDPLADRTNSSKRSQPLKLLSVEGLKKALSNAGKVTTNAHSQGIRFLSEVTEKMCPKKTNKGPAMPNLQMDGLGKRSLSSNTINDSKRKKTEHGREGKAKQATEKMIELDVSSDEGIVQSCKMCRLTISALSSEEANGPEQSSGLLDEDKKFGKE